MAILKVYTRRHGHHDDYQVDWTDTGWHVRHISHGGDCDKEDKPVLYDALAQDVVNYPAQLGEYLEHLWNQVKEGKVKDPQAGLNQLADWIEACETTAPNTGPFSGL